MYMNVDKNRNTYPYTYIQKNNKHTDIDQIPLSRIKISESSFQKREVRYHNPVPRIKSLRSCRGALALVTRSVNYTVSSKRLKNKQLYTLILAI